MRSLRFFCSFLVLAFALSAQQKQPESPASPILGFSPRTPPPSTRSKPRFNRFRLPKKAREWHRTFTAEPHPAASDRNNQLADFVADAWRKQGWKASPFAATMFLHSRPRSISLEMTEPVHFTASLREDAYDADPDTKNSAVSGSYFGYSASGDVSTEVIYAHSGNPEDYDLLRKNGISVKGKIVLVRYSNPYSYRGFKALTAEREGAAALLIYSDPAKMATRKEKFSPMAPGARKVTFSAARSLTITSFPAIPPRPAGHRSPAQNTSRRKKRVRSRKFPRSHSRGATPNRFSKT